MNINFLKQILFSLMLFSSYSTINGQQRIINTSIGEIAVYQKSSTENNTPVIFLHGLFLDHHLWDSHIEAINDRNVFTVDMPMHGKSTNGILSDWNLEDCKTMLIEILNALNLEKVHAVGHSWGGMTILRAAESYPHKFESINLFNTPIDAYTKQEVRLIKLQHLGLPFKKIYIKKASQNIFAKSSLNSNPELFNYLNSCLSEMSNRTIRILNKAVRINATDKTSVLENLKMKFNVIVGEEDKIAPAPPSKNVIIVKGGHTSPLEFPQKSLEIILSNF